MDRKPSAGGTADPLLYSVAEKRRCLSLLWIWYRWTLPWRHRRGNIRRPLDLQTVCHGRGGSFRKDAVLPPDKIYRGQLRRGKYYLQSDIPAGYGIPAVCPADGWQRALRSDHNLFPLWRRQRTICTRCSEPSERNRPVAEKRLYYVFSDRKRGTGQL